MHIDNSPNCTMTKACREGLSSTAIVIKHLCDADVGDSGSPMVDLGTGRAFAVLVGGFDETLGMNKAISISALLKLNLLDLDPNSSKEYLDIDRDGIIDFIAGDL